MVYCGGRCEMDGSNRSEHLGAFARMPAIGTERYVAVFHPAFVVQVAVTARSVWPLAVGK